MSSPVATVIIPFAPYHSEIVQFAIDSAKAQTVDCQVLAFPSERTPATVRNQAAYSAATLFVVFLDADDWLEPDFVETCLRAYQPGRYVYTDWYCGDVVRGAALCAVQYQPHLVTTLYPTAIFKALGGFDETLPAHEDVDFYLRSHRHGICGTYINKPLLHYTEHGQRSTVFKAMPDNKAIIHKVWERNGGDRTVMGCCGQPGIQTPGNPGKEYPGDVKAQTLWSGMHSEVGHVSGRVYVGGNGMVINVDPQDVAAMPHLFLERRDLAKLAPDKQTVLKQAGL